MHSSQFHYCVLVGCIIFLCVFFFFYITSLFFFFFFFSSRRRHTRCGRDWSSDVCSSDLVFGQFNAVEAIQQRGSLNQQIFDSVLEAIDNPAVIIESVQVEDVAFSVAYEQSVEARMMAEVEVQRRSQELEQQIIQAQIVVTQAQGDADARVAQAKAQAEATRLAGDAEASAIRAKGEALREAPELIALTTAENWDGVLPTTMLPGGTVPFLGLGQ